MSTTAFNNVSGIFLEFKISNKTCLCILSSAFSYSTNNECVSKLYSLHFSINDSRQNNLFPTLVFLSPINNM